MKEIKKSILSIVCLFVLSISLAVTAFAQATMSHEEVMVRRRAYYPIINQFIGHLYEKEANRMPFEIQRIIVGSPGDFTTAEAVQTQISQEGFLPSLELYIQFRTSNADGTEYVFHSYPSNYPTYDLVEVSSSTIVASNYNYGCKYVDGQGGDSIQILGDGYALQSVLSQKYYLEIDLADYQNSGYSLTGAVYNTDAERAAAVAAGYYKGSYITVSGAADLSQNYTWQDGGTSQPCFVLQENDKRWYVAVQENLYPYFVAAFNGQSVTMKAAYEGIATDGTPVLSTSNASIIDESGNSEKIVDFVWNGYSATQTEPDFIAFAALYGSGYMTEVAKDGSYLSIDTNPLNFDGSKIVGLIHNYTGVEIVERANQAFGLPDWLSEEMERTRAIDGRQREEFDNLVVSWIYHPNSGLEVMYRKNS